MWDRISETCFEKAEELELFTSAVNSYWDQSHGFACKKPRAKLKSSVTGEALCFKLSEMDHPWFDLS